MKSYLSDLKKRMMEELDSEIAAEYAITQKGPSLRSGSESGAETNMTPSIKEGTRNHWAVLVGIDRYKDPSFPELNVCAKDATAIHQQLLRSGYHHDRIQLLTDRTKVLPDRVNILDCVKAMAETAMPEDVILFYYSGHGDLDDREKRPHFVARDSRKYALEHSGVSLENIVGIFEESQAYAKVIIVDACHSGAILPDGRKGSDTMSPEFIERVFKQAQGQVVLASCAKHQYSWPMRQQSVFTHFLLEALSGKADFDNKRLVTVQDVHRYVSDRVSKWAFQNKKPQTPTLAGVMAGDIILATLT